MIWSLARVLFFVAAVAALAFGLGLLIERGEGVRIAVAGWEFTLGPVVAAALLVALVVVVWLGLRLAGLAVATLRFLAGDETAVSRYFDRTRARRGMGVGFAGGWVPDAHPQLRFRSLKFISVLIRHCIPPRSRRHPTPAFCIVSW